MDNWISISSNSGSSGTSSVSVTAQTNTGLSRTTQVTVTATKFGRTKTATVSVAQTTSISGISMTNIVPDSTGGTYVITVSSETPYTVSASDPTWIILTPESGIAGVTTIIVVIPANTTGSGRTGGITATTTDNQYSDSISFTQEDLSPYYTTYFKTRSLSDNNTISFVKQSQTTSAYATSISYSLDSGVTWVTTNVNSSQQTISVPGLSYGDVVFWKGIADRWTVDTERLDQTSHFYASNVFEVEGNVMSLLYGDNFMDATNVMKPYALECLFMSASTLLHAENLVLPLNTLAEGCYAWMFCSCHNLLEAPTLPARNLADHCYWSMFCWCYRLQTAPALHAMQLSKFCYASMFSACTSLTTAPELPATTLDSQCYRSMFGGCTGLTTAPSILPATTLTDECYRWMFSGCTNLTTTPVLPATELDGYYCYDGMFERCTSLATAPNLPATALTYRCYYSMFYGCTSLTTAPALPATTLDDNCYSYMFYGCTSLTTAPELPATTLAEFCYGQMFYGCTSLATAPNLPATTLTGYCYNSMFYGCTSLTTAPELPATTLVSRCYYSMFYGCTQLNYIKCLAKSGINSNNSTTDWVKNVSSSGTFVRAQGASWPTSANGKPSGWTVQDAT